jgi:MFS family permease
MAWKTPQFWLLWAVLCLNVSAGIGVIGMASPMLQEMFGGRLVGIPQALSELTAEQKAQVASIGAGFAALLSFFNIIGRIGWASASDFLGRKRTYAIFFLLGAVLYAAAPFAGRIGSVPLFVALFCLILTMYGGGFATIPAYLADLFGTRFVGAIHGRLLTAWSTAGVLGPVLVNYIREYQLERGVPAAQAYNVTMYILAGLLVLGFASNLMVRPVAQRFYMTDDGVASK